MKICGIISEYNPFHSGHAYLVDRAKQVSDVVVAVMSGHFVQRGDVSVVDKYTRARCALLGGVDLVLELPIPFCASSASFFAKAGVDVLSMVGTNMLAFGSESGDVDRLCRLAERLLSGEDREIDVGEGSAAAHFKGILDGEGERLSPNDILAVEYLAAIRRSGLDMSPLAVVRKGDGFLCETTGASAYASATALRKCMKGGDIAALVGYMPKECYDQLCQSLSSGEAPASPEHAARAILGYFRLTAPEALSDIAGLGNGLEHRLCECARKAGSLEEMLSLASTKRYPDATIRRAVIAAMLGVRYADLDRGAAYTNVLGANERGRMLLASIRKSGSPILTKPSDIDALCARHKENEHAIRRQAELSMRADALYSLCLPNAGAADRYIKRDAVML